MGSLRLQSQDRGGSKWLGLLAVVLAVVYLAFVWVYVQSAGLFDYIGFDYRVFLASAEIAVSSGFAAVYYDGDPDLPIQGQFQRPLYEAHALGPARANYATGPMYYLPAFILLFLPMLLLPAVPGFVVWTILNALLLFLYLWRFMRAVGERGGRAALVLVLLSYPAFLNLFFGQVNVFLLIFFGEFLLASLRGRAFRGGLWLGGLLLKPQTLVLLLPGLLCQSLLRVLPSIRRKGGSWGEGRPAGRTTGGLFQRVARQLARIGQPFEALLGFTVAALVILGLSLLLAGVEGLTRLFQQILLFPGEQSTTVPGLMMNWRGLAANLEVLLPSQLTWAVAIAGVVLTAGAALSLWLRPVEPPSPRLVLVLLGTYAATCAITWHSHIHMALPLVAPLLYLHARRWLPRGVLALWASLPALVFFMAAFPLPRLAANLAGLSTLVLNLGLVAWAAPTFWRSRRPRGPCEAAASVIEAGRATRKSE